MHERDQFKKKRCDGKKKRKKSPEMKAVSQVSQKKLLSNNDNSINSNDGDDDHFVALMFSSHFFHAEGHMDLPVMEKRSKNKLGDDATGPTSRCSTRPGG